MTHDASFASADPAKPLKLSAEDPQDLTVISACLQDAVTRRASFTYQQSQRRFAAVFNRFQWEGGAGDRHHGGDRIRAGIHFDSVMAVRSRGLPNKRDAILELLAIACETKADGLATVTLAFAGGGAIQLEVECIDCYLSDLGRPWAAVRRPTHVLGEGEAGSN